MGLKGWMRLAALPLLFAGGVLFSAEFTTLPLGPNPPFDLGAIFQDISDVQRVNYYQSINNAKTLIVELRAIQDAQNKQITSLNDSYLLLLNELKLCSLLLTGLLLTLCILWGLYSWRLFVLAKNQSSFF